MENAWVVCGLGNPGSRYENTRHNLGFMALQELSPGVVWKTDKDALVSSFEIGGRKIFGVMPQSFMNLSGEPLCRLMQFYKVPANNLIVLHDELDLELGKIRIKMGGGIAGHNGLRSIVEKIGTGDFFRIRLGIGRPLPGQHDTATSWVLAKFSQEETTIVGGLLPRVSEAVKSLIIDGLAAAQRLYN